MHPKLHPRAPAPAPLRRRSMAGMDLSSQLDANMHSGAQDLRDALFTPNTAFLPTSWQASLDQLSYSVIGLWDSIVRAVEMFLF